MFKYSKCIYYIIKNTFINKEDFQVFISFFIQLLYNKNKKHYNNL
jgi:hypothetical protein